jgi:glycosyltransferase involved in cell wall biosynthesis
MIIGIDASRAYVSDKTGTENYSYHVISEMLRLPDAKKHYFVLFIRPNAKLPSELVGYSNVLIKKINYRFLWTQIGLAWETWNNQVFQYSGDPVIQQKTGVQEDRRTGGRKLDVLWIPAHTLPVLRKPGLQTVVTIHGLEYKWLKEYNNILQRWYLPLSTFYAAKYADKLIAVSQNTANELQKEVQNISNNITVIHEGVSLSSFPVIQYSSEVLHKYGIEKKKYVLFVGSVQPRKNLVALIEAFSIFSRDNPDYRLVIAGGIGWMAEGVLGAPKRYGMQEKIVFTGRIDDSVLQALYLGAKMYVQPSITEGFGLPVLEAMVYGVPVISSDGGALPEIVGDSGVVLKLKNDFVQQLAKTMHKIVTDSNFVNIMIEKGKLRARAFSWQKAAQETLELLITTGLNKS